MSVANDQPGDEATADAPLNDMPLVRRLQQQREGHWFEVKKDNTNPEKIGQNLSAVSNGAALDGERCGFLIWGFEDKTHHAVGTKFRPRRKQHKNQELLHWLQTMLEPRHEVRVRHDGPFGDVHVVVLEVAAAVGHPTRFAGEAYIRVESSTKPLKAASGKEARLWEMLRRQPFEEGVAMEDASGNDVLELLDHTEAFRLLKVPLPDGRKAILDRLASPRIQAVRPAGGDHYDVTNLGAILFARSLDEFPGLWRKKLRVIHYNGANKTGGARPEQPYDRGYAVGFAEAIRRINEQLPANEEIGQALRVERRLFPEVAIRELVANALIHQDFAPPGVGPVVEIYDGRLEVVNPGRPVIDPLRFIDEQARSRNDRLAHLMRQMGIAEEQGTGIDKAVAAIELYQMPPPDFRQGEQSTVAVLYGPRGFTDMTRDERMRACYQHAVLLYLSNRRMTNETLRERLGIAKSNYPAASRIIKDAREAGLVRGFSETGSTRDASYLPFWA